MNLGTEHRWTEVNDLNTGRGLATTAGLHLQVL